MKKYLNFAIVLFLFTACSTDTSTTSSNSIADLEKAYEADPTKQGELIAAYQAYIADNPDDSAKIPGLMSKMAQLFIKDNRIQEALPLLGKLLRKYPGSSSETQGYDMMANLFGGQLNLPALAKPLFGKLAQLDPTNEGAKAFLSANAEAPALDGFLESLKANFIDTESGNINRTAIRDFQRGVTVRGLTTDDDQSIDWLLTGGETARMVKNNLGAIEFYDWILDKYGDQPKSSQALFLKAFTYDNEMNQDEVARPLYEAFMAKYPNNDFADDAKFLLDNLGKSDEEIIQNFQKGDGSK